MDPATSVNTNLMLTLPGGTDENNLPAYRTIDQFGNNVICSVWKPTDEERELISKGYNVQLVVWGKTHPPVSIAITDEEIISDDHEIVPCEQCHGIGQLGIVDHVGRKVLCKHCGGTGKRVIRKENDASTDE